MARVGVLGVVAAAALLTGDVVPGQAPAVAESRAAATAPAPSVFATKRPVVRTDFQVVVAAEPAAAKPPVALANGTGVRMTVEELAAMRDQAEQTSRDLERSALPGCDGVVNEAGANGRLSPDDLCVLWEDGHMLRADAAVTLARLSTAYETAFGERLCLTDTYRSYDSQVQLRASKPGLAAEPGTSQHGWGMAADLCGGVQKAGERHAWMVENAPEFGWDNPDWARKGGSGPHEPWHWEYVAGQG